MLYTIPHDMIGHATDCQIHVDLTDRNCFITLLHEGTIIDNATYRRARDGAVRVPGDYKQTLMGAANHAVHYWFIPTNRRSTRFTE